MASLLCKGLCKICCLPCECIKSLRIRTGDLCSGPFFLYNTIAFALNIPPIILSIIAVTTFDSDCRDDIWLLVNLPLCISHLIVAWYVTKRISDKDDLGLRNAITIYSRAKLLLCHDPWVALYIIIYIFFIVWICIGLGWNAEDKDICGDYSSISIFCAIPFIVFGSISLFVSLCISWCRNDTHYSQRNRTSNNESRTENQQQSLDNSYDHDHHDVEIPIAVATPVDDYPSNSKGSSSSSKPIPSAPPLPSVNNTNDQGQADESTWLKSNISFLAKRGSQGFDYVKKNVKTKMSKTTSTKM